MYNYTVFSSYPRLFLHQNQSRAISVSMFLPSIGYLWSQAILEAALGRPQRFIGGHQNSLRAMLVMTRVRPDGPRVVVGQSVQAVFRGHIFQGA